jgi:hypothetical protein
MTDNVVQGLDTDTNRGSQGGGKWLLAPFVGKGKNYDVLGNMKKRKARGKDS